MPSRHIPELIKKRIFQEAQMRCPECGELDVTTFEIHHIQPFSQVKRHDEDNLILLCSNCHSKATAGQLSEVDLLRLKVSLTRRTKKLREQSSDSFQSAPPSNVICLSEVRNSGVIANNATVTTTKRQVKLLPPPGSVASSLLHRNYIKYLIDRYHEFKVHDVGRSAMRYQVLYGAIKRNFGAKWDHISVEKFNELSLYLHQRIDRTRLGKKLKARGRARYSTFVEYQHKHS